MKIYFKTGNGSFCGMNVLPENTTKQVTHKMEDKGGIIKPCSVISLSDSLCNCGKTVNQLLLGDVLAEIETEYKPSEENDELLDNN